VAIRGRPLRAYLAFLVLIAMLAGTLIHLRRRLNPPRHAAAEFPVQEILGLREMAEQTARG
jgi:hypothetical protein